MLRRTIAAILVGIAGAHGCGPPGTSPTETDSSGCPVGAYLPAPKSGWPCPPLSVIREIDARISLEFVADPTAGTLVCRAADGSADLTRLQERAYQALLLIKQLEFDAPLPWTSSSLWDWFTRAVRGVRFVIGDRAFCCNPVGVINVPVAGAYEPGFPTMQFGFIHEARHADAWYPHTCGTRDRTIAELGAFGVQYHFGIWMAEHAIAPALTAEERRHVRNASDLLRTSAFCQDCGL